MGGLITHGEWMNTANNPAPINWKQRYQELVGQQEKQQLIIQRKQGLLVEAMSALIKFGRDIDPSADEKLLAMRGLLRKKSYKSVELARVVEALEPQLDDSLKSRKLHQQQINRNLKLLAKIGQSYAAHKDVKKELSEFRKAVDIQPLRYQVVAGHLGQLAELHALARHDARSQQSILQRWFGGSQEAEQPILPSLDTIAGSLIRLLGEIEPVSDMRDSFEIASGLLAEGLTTDNVEVVIKSVTDVVVAAIHVDRADMTTYLSDMNRRLEEATADIIQSQSILGEERSASEAFGQSLQESFGKMRSDVKAEHDLGRLKHRINESLDAMTAAAVQHQEQGQQIHLRLSDQLEELAARARMLELQGKEAEQKVVEQRRRALTDKLTGLPNRDAYEEVAAREVQRWQRYERPLAIAVLDIDLFKAVNDSYGHVAGDSVLQEVARIMRERLRGSDFVARFGGEEFVVLLPETELDQAEQVMESLRLGIEQANIHWQEHPLGLTVSIGVAHFRAKDILQSAFTRADKALYQAKASGRDRVVVARD